METPSFFLDRYRNAELTIDELAEAAATLLNRLGVRASDGRVASALDARGIRYYQTIGIVDHPLRYDGRQAVFGFRHLIQLLAAKRLQQEGQALQLIQQSLSGCPTPVLEQALETVLSGPGQPRVRGTAASAAPLMVARLGPGVTVTIDPSLVGDADALVRRLTAAITPEPTASGCRDQRTGGRRC